MGKAKVFWTDEALYDLDLIFDFLFEKTPNAAVNSVKAILARTRQLREFPESGAIAEVDDYRFLVEGHYKIYYRRNDQEVFIVAVFDTRQNPSSLKLPT